MTKPAEPSGANCGRATLRRVLFIHERLGNGLLATAVSLARELESSQRTIKRDIEFMRDQLGAPIGWDASAHTYHYSRACDLLPLLRLDAGEALALALAGRTFAAWHGTPLGRALTAALDKIAGVVGGTVSLPVSEIDHLVSHQPGAGGAAVAEHRHFATSLEAIIRHRVLRIVYQKPRAGVPPETRLVHPLHLACLDHRWVLIAHDPARHAIRNFLLARIREASATPAAFNPPTGFDLPTYLRGSLGRFTGGDEIEIRLVFDAELAPSLEEIRKIPALRHILAEATIWQSSTPFVPPRYQKKSGRNTLAGQVAEELTSRGFPSPERIEFLREESVGFRHFVRTRRDGARPPVDLSRLTQRSY